MPKGKGKKFIDKKNSVTFQLVHRSQKDPLVADEDAPQRIFMPVEDPQAAKHQKKAEAGKKKEELEKFGIFYEDDYDYMQHLRPVENSIEWERVENPNDKKKEIEKEKLKINLPPTVMESEEQEEVGLLNRAIPTGLRLDLDPDVVAALDDDFDFDDPENQLEDDFLTLAGGVLKEDEIVENDYEFDEEDEDYDNELESEDDSSGHMEVSDEEEDDVPSLCGKQFTFKDEETRSRFSEYSMSSSVIKRNSQLTLLDKRFEKMYEEYDDIEIGSLEGREIEDDCIPYVDSLLQHAKKAEKLQTEFQSETKEIVQLMKDRLKILEQENPNFDDEQDLAKLVVEARERGKWDCESILSTYSNIYNHPKLISEPKGPGKIKTDSKTGIPKDVLGSRKLTAKSLAHFDSMNAKGTQEGPQSVAETIRSVLSVLSIRPKDETPEERKDRKKALKEYRKERRIERKANIEAFKEEKKRQEKILLNNKKNVQGNHLL